MTVERACDALLFRFSRAREDEREGMLLTNDAGVLIGAALEHTS